MKPFDDARAETRRSMLCRTSLTVSLLAFGGNARLARATEMRGAAASSEADQTAEVAKLAKKAGLEPFRASRTDHFLGLGNAPDPFREAALEICESLSRVFLPHLRDRGFKVAFPDDRMTVIVLKDVKSYEALLGEAPGADVGGHFDLNSNRLVIFDFRPGQGEEKAGAERINTFTLVHETAHLLCFNTGLLSIDHEPPKCITEGLATYFEMWRPKARAGVGSINRPRLLAIRAAGETDEPWIETASLLADDAYFDHEKTAQLAYGQSWMLVYSLLKNRSKWAGLLGYLEEVGTLGTRGDRLKTAEKHLGSLSKLDERLKKEARSFLRDVRD